jgi:hypothetical protein
MENNAQECLNTLCTQLLGDEHDIPCTHNGNQENIMVTQAIIKKYKHKRILLNPKIKIIKEILLDAAPIFFFVLAILTASFLLVIGCNLALANIYGAAIISILISVLIMAIVMSASTYKLRR